MDSRIEKYAKLLIRKGVNIQKGQSLVLRISVDNAAFARLCVAEAYKAGCREVFVEWGDDIINRERYLHAEEAIFDTVRPWVADKFNTLAGEGAAFLAVVSDDPEALAGVDPSRIRRSSMASGKAMMPYRSALNADKTQWCVAAVPNPVWAKKVFPDKAEDEAVSLLWDAILTCSRVTEKNDPVTAWQAHAETLLKRVDILNNYKFKYLRYHNALGTDLTVELPEGHIWEGARSLSAKNVEFLPNIPTEEVFTSPKRDGVNGVVYAAKPLVVNGNIVDGFHFVLQDGRIVELHAEKGEAFLQSAVDTDEGSHYLGEVALVPYASPISQSGLLFYETLFDENAACHFAFGSAYPTIEGGREMDDDELLAHGLNVSITHNDFMVGTADLSIIGVTHDGREIPVFVDGNFAF